MDEIAALSQEIEFHEKFRGYDPDEVEAYVDRVRKTAALAIGRISELHQRAEAAEALIAAGRVDSAEETLGRTLLLAQQTADDLVSEATDKARQLTDTAAERAAAVIASAEESSTAAVERARAESEAIRREAEDRSSRILAEAETDRRDMIRRAEAEAEATATEAHRRLEAEVAGLTNSRGFLEDDIEILERHVREQRANLSKLLSSLTHLVDDPESFRLDPAPATSGVTIVDGSSSVDEPHPAYEAIDHEQESDQSDGEPAPPDPVEVPEAAQPDLVADQPVDDIVAPEDPPLVEAEVHLEVVDDQGEVVEEEMYAKIEADVPVPADTTNRPEDDPGDTVIDLDRVVTFDPRPIGEDSQASAEPPVTPRLMTAADLDTDGLPPSDSGPATAPIPVVTAEPLFAEATAGDGSTQFAARGTDLGDGDLLATDSDALSAFFDQDDDEIDRSWFGRRR